MYLFQEFTVRVKPPLKTMDQPNFTGLPWGGGEFIHIVKLSLSKF